MQYQPRPLRAGSGRLRGGRLGGLQRKVLSALLWPSTLKLPCARPSSFFGQGPSTLTPPVVATAEWVLWVGIVRPHSAIGMRTPPSTKSPGLPTPTRTARNSHNRQPPEPTHQPPQNLGIDAATRLEGPAVEERTSRLSLGPSAPTGARCSAPSKLSRSLGGWISRSRPGDPGLVYPNRQRQEAR